MKNILICGIAKSGKSYLANKININHEYNYIPMDYFVSSFKYNIPEANITSNVVIDKTSSEKLGLFLSRVIEIMDMVSDKENYIIDSAHLYPKDIIKYIDKDKWDIYFLGYPNISVEDKFNQIRKYVHGGWPNKKTDEELKGILNNLINLSKEIEEECKIYGINFIDASDFSNIENFSRN